MAGYQCRLRTNSAIRMLTPNGNSWRKRATGWDRARSKYGRLYEMADWDGNLTPEFTEIHDRTREKLSGNANIHRRSNDQRLPNT